MSLPRTLFHPLLLLAGLLLPQTLPRPAQAQLFAQPKLIPTGNWPAAIYSADLNGDGFPDLVYLDQGATPTASTTHVLLNDGHGNFHQSAVLATAGDSLALGDILFRGRVDIGWISASSTPAGSLTRNVISLTVAGNQGDGTFFSPTSQTVVDTTHTRPMEFHHLIAGNLEAGQQWHILAGDPNNGIIYDLIFLNSSPVYRNYQILTPPDGVGPMTLKDLNGDGRPDLIVTSTSQSTAQVLLADLYNNFPPYGSINATSNFTRTTGVHSLLLQDVNFDSIPDLIAEGPNGHLDVFPGNGDGTFQTSSAGGTGPLDGLTSNGGHLIAIADLNHDGLPDALAATPLGISALLGQGTAYLGLKGIYNAGPGRSSYATADFNGDGNLDLAVDSPEGIALLFGNADGSFQTAQAFAAGQPALSGALGAFTASGHLDAVLSTAATQAQLLLGHGDGTFTAAPAPTSTQTGPAGLWSIVQVGDFDSDGTLDLLLTADGPSASLPKTPGGAQIQLGNGNGSFAAPQPLTYPSAPACPQAAGDFYGTSALGSNLLGAVIINRADDGAHYIFNGNHHFPSGEFFNDGINGTQPCGPYAHNLAVTGVFTARNTTTQSVTDTFAQADGHLYLYPAYAQIGVFNSPSGDLSGDGSLTTLGQLTAPALSATFNGPAIPTSAGGLGFPAFIGSMTVADLDRDGNNDLIVTYANLSANLQAPTTSAPNYIYFWFGDGTGHFPVSAAHPVNPVRLTPSRNFYQAAVADLNGDHIPDLILSDGYLLSVQYGKGDGSFGAETHFLSGQGINTLSIADVNGDGKPDLVLANGGAVLANPVANLDILATNPDVSTGGITVLLNQATFLPTPTGSIVASPEPSLPGALFTLVATLTVPPGGPTPTGTITFAIDGSHVGAPTTILGINPTGIVYPAANTLAPGSHVLTATYSGDANYSSSILTGSHAVAPLTSPLTLTAAPEPSTYGASFLITAVYSPSNTPANFIFSVDGTAIGTIFSTTGSASIAGPSTLAVGPHALAVTWLSTQSAIATQATATHTITINTSSLSLRLCVDAPGSNFPCGNPLANTPLVSPISMYFGQTLDGVATESSTLLTGTINFLANGNSFCIITASLAGGANTCPPTAGNFQAGTYTVDAVYSGDANNTPSTSNSIFVGVLPDLTSATITSSANPAVLGTPVTLTAQVQGNFAIPSGVVLFYDGPTRIGGGILDATGSATLTTSALALGTHPITVNYAGPTNFNPATSAVFSQVIVAVATPPPAGPASFTLAVTPSPLTLGVGRTGMLLITITPINGFAQPVQLTCAGLPNETACTFVSPTITGGGSTTLQFATAAPHDCGDPGHPYFLGRNGGQNRPSTPILWASLLLFASGLFRARLPRSRSARTAGALLLLAFGLIGLSSLSGCGRCTDLGTRPGTYTFTVTATAQGSPISETQSQTIPLTMTIP